MAASIRLVLADVDGTLVTPDKVLTDQAVDAVRQLRDANILFAITSGRPPRGMAMLIEPLDLDTPIAAFNGGILVDRDMSVIEQHVIPSDLVVPIADLVTSFGLTVWIYQGADWYVPDPNGPHVDREAWTVKFEPKVMTSVAAHTDGVAKIVGVSDDHDAVEKAAAGAHDRFGDHVAAAASQPYYLDITHPKANKGEVAMYLSAPLSPLDRGDRHDWRHAERRVDVRSLGPEHRDGERRSPSPASCPAGNGHKRKRGVRKGHAPVRAVGMNDRRRRNRRTEASGTQRHPDPDPDRSLLPNTVPDERLPGRPA